MRIGTQISQLQTELPKPRRTTPDEEITSQSNLLADKTAFRFEIFQTVRETICRRVRAQLFALCLLALLLFPALRSMQLSWRPALTPNKFQFAKPEKVTENFDSASANLRRQFR
jgi:hypothetical protein